MTNLLEGVANALFGQDPVDSNNQPESGSIADLLESRPTITISHLHCGLGAGTSKDLHGVEEESQSLAYRIVDLVVKNLHIIIPVALKAGMDLHKYVTSHNARKGD